MKGSLICGPQVSRSTFSVIYVNMDSLDIKGGREGQTD